MQVLLGNSATYLDPFSATDETKGWCIQVLLRSGSAKEKKWAARIEPVSSSTIQSQCNASSAREAVVSRNESLVRWQSTKAPAMQVLRRPHFLLVTLVLCNAAATEVGAKADIWQCSYISRPVILAVLQALQLLQDRQFI